MNNKVLCLLLLLTCICSFPTMRADTNGYVNGHTMSLRENGTGASKESKGSNDLKSDNKNVELTDIIANMILKGDYDGALELCNRLPDEQYSLELKLKVYVAAKDYQRAFECQKKIIDLSSQNRHKQTDLERKAMQKKLNELYNLNVQEKSINSQKATLVISIIIFIGLITSIFFIMRRYIEVKKKNLELLENIHRIVEYKNKIDRIKSENDTESEGQPVYADGGANQDMTPEDAQRKLSDIISDSALLESRNIIADEENEEKNVINDISEDDKTTGSKEGEPDNPSDVRPEIMKVVKYIRHNKLYLDKEFDRDELLRKLHVKKSDFVKNFENVMGKSFYEYINFMRIIYACKMIRSNKNYVIDAIAQECGFDTYNTFRNNFSRFTGMLPSEYRKKVREDKDFMRADAKNDSVIDDDRENTDNEEQNNINRKDL